MSRWHKGERGSWWRVRDNGFSANGRVVIERSYTALTASTWWVIRGLAGFDGRAFTRLRAAQACVDAELARLGGPGALTRLGVELTHADATRPATSKRELLEGPLCRACDGTGVLHDEDAERTCTRCDGRGES